MLASAKGSCAISAECSGLGKVCFGFVGVVREVPCEGIGAADRPRVEHQQVAWRQEDGLSSKAPRA